MECGERLYFLHESIVNAHRTEDELKSLSKRHGENLQLFKTSQDIFRAALFIQFFMFILYIQNLTNMIDVSVSMTYIHVHHSHHNYTAHVFGSFNEDEWIFSVFDWLIRCCQRLGNIYVWTRKRNHVTQCGSAAEKWTEHMVSSNVFDISHSIWFCFCFISVKFDVLANAAYSSNWYQCNAKIKRYYLLMIMTSQRIAREDTSIFSFNLEMIFKVSFHEHINWLTIFCLILIFAC